MSPRDKWPQKRPLRGNGAGRFGATGATTQSAESHYDLDCTNVRADRAGGSQPLCTYTFRDALPLHWPRLFSLTDLGGWSCAKHWCPYVAGDALPLHRPRLFAYRMRPGRPCMNGSLSSAWMEFCKRWCPYIVGDALPLHRPRLLQNAAWKTLYRWLDPAWMARYMTVMVASCSYRGGPQCTQWPYRGVSGTATFALC